MTQPAGLSRMLPMGLLLLSLLLLAEAQPLAASEVGGRLSGRPAARQLDGKKVASAGLDKQEHKGKEVAAAEQEEKDQKEKVLEEEQNRDELVDKREEAEEEEEPEPRDVAIAAMLCGLIAFQMMIFYAVNYRDSDMRFYFWGVLSSTVAIFTSTLIFSAFRRTAEHILFQNADLWRLTLAAYLLLVVCFAALYIAITVCVGIIRVPWIVAPEDDRMASMSWGKLLSYIVSFASINAAGTFMQLPFIRDRVWCVLLVVLVHQLLVHLLFVGSEAFGRYCQETIDDDEMHSLWRRRVEQSENDVATISGAFLLVQTLRFAISGELPGPMGTEALSVKTQQQVLGLGGCAVGLGLMILALVFSSVRADSWSNERTPSVETTLPKLRRTKTFLELKDISTRPMLIAQTTAATAFAWCLFYTAKWELVWVVPGADPNAMAWRVTMALVLSFSSFGFILFLDWLEDLEQTPPAIDQALEHVIEGLGVLVGFSWEQSFDGAVENISTLFPNAAAGESAIALIIAIMVVPAWKRWIFRSTLQAALEFQSDPEKPRQRIVSTALEKEVILKRLKSRNLYNPSDDDEESFTL